jgi:ankyrin repeat protein
MLLDAGAVTKYEVPGLLDMFRGRLDRLAELLDKDPSLVNRRFPELDFGSTAMRRLQLQGGTLLHVAAEYCNVDAVRLLLDRGADVNAPADGAGQTPIFHAASQFDDKGLAAAELLLDRGADLAVRVKLPGHIRQPDEIVECTPLGYAMLFPGDDPSHAGRLRSPQTIALLRARGGVE